MAIVVSDMELAHRHLQLFDMEPISPVPQTIPADNPAAGGVQAFRFRDVDGHSLELIWFPADKRKPKWQAPGERLFLGIDHSEIAISQTEKSLAFYQDILGLSVASGSNNTGTVQATLDNLPAADVKITSLQPSDQPTSMGIELLEYLQPQDSRPRPQIWQMKDLPHRHLVLDVDSLNLHGLNHHKITIVSPGIVQLPDAYRYSRGVLIKDPDGHSLLLVAAP